MLINEKNEYLLKMKKEIKKKKHRKLKIKEEKVLSIIILIQIITMFALCFVDNESLKYVVIANAVIMFILNIIRVFINDSLEKEFSESHKKRLSKLFVMYLNSELLPQKQYSNIVFETDSDEYVETAVYIKASALIPSVLYENEDNFKKIETEINEVATEISKYLSKYTKTNVRVYYIPCDV